MNFFAEVCITLAALFGCYLAFMATLSLHEISVTLKSIDRALNFQADITNDVSKLLKERL